ncbi:hypothetical protein ACT3UN_15245 [Corynebacterium sp. AOP12-C2-36]
MHIYIEYVPEGPASGRIRTRRKKTLTMGHVVTFASSNRFRVVNVDAFTRDIERLAPNTTINVVDREDRLVELSGEEDGWGYIFSEDIRDEDLTPDEHAVYAVGGGPFSDLTDKLSSLVVRHLDGDSVAVANEVYIDLRRAGLGANSTAVNASDAGIAEDFNEFRGRAAVLGTVM